MLHPDVLVLGYSEASMILGHPGDADICAVIAIYGQREHAIDVTPISKRLVLNFDDIEPINETDPLSAARIGLRRRMTEKDGLRPIPPTWKHAKSIIEFAESIRQLDGTLLCQCNAGISRSAAAALLCLATWTGPGAEADCARRVLAVRPAAMPHRGLVAMGDDLLTRNGRLVEAVNRMTHT